jgi:gas vesicle protein
MARTKAVERGNNSLSQIKNVMRSGKVLLGVLAGVAVGTTLGMLFAPHKGSATRRKISHKSREYKDELEEKFSEFAGSISDKVEKLKKEAAGMAKKGIVRAEDIIAEVQ